MNKKIHIFLFPLLINYASANANEILLDETGKSRSLPKIKTSNTQLRYGDLLNKLKILYGKNFISEMNLGGTHVQNGNYTKLIMRQSDTEKEIFSVNYKKSYYDINSHKEIYNSYIFEQIYNNCKTGEGNIKYLDYNKSISFKINTEKSVFFYDGGGPLSVNIPSDKYYFDARSGVGNILPMCRNGSFDVNTGTIIYSIISSLYSSNLKNYDMSFFNDFGYRAPKNVAELLNTNSEKTPEYIDFLYGYYYKFGRTSADGLDVYISSNMDRIIAIDWYQEKPSYKYADFSIRAIPSYGESPQYENSIPENIIKSLGSKQSQESILDNWRFTPKQNISFSVPENKSDYLKNLYLSYRDLQNQKINNSVSIDNSYVSKLSNIMIAMYNVYSQLDEQKIINNDFNIENPVFYQKRSIINELTIMGHPEALYRKALDLAEDKMYLDISKGYLIKAIDSPLAKPQDIPRYQAALNAVERNISVAARNAEIQAIKDRESEARAIERKQEQDRQNLSLILQTMANLRQRAEAEAQQAAARRERQRQEAAEQARLQAQREQTAAYERQQQLNRQAADQRAFEDRRAAAIQAERVQQQQTSAPTQSYSSPPPQQSSQSSSGVSQAQADAERRRQEQLAQERQRQQQLQASYARAMDFMQAQASSTTNGWALSLYNRNNFRVQCTVSVDGESWAYGSSTPFHDSQVLIIASGEQRDAQWSPLREGDGSNSRTRRILNNQYSCRAMP